MSLQIWLGTLWFAALILVIALYALSASGQFPKEHRAFSLASGLGKFMLFGSILLTLLCFAGAVSIAWMKLPWYATVIGGGISLLIAPLILQAFPDSFVDGRSSLLTFSGVAILLLLAKWVGD